MIRNYFLLFFRNIKRDKTSFFINLIGLSTGLACILLIYLWVSDELSVDKFHEKDKRLFQVMGNYPIPNGFETEECTPGLLAQALAEEIPEVEYSAAVIPPGWFPTEGIISHENIQLKAMEQYVGKDYFNIFSYRLIQGDRNQLLPNKSCILISDALARKLFNSTKNVIGKTIEWKRERFKRNFSGVYTISGIFEKPPPNSTDQFDVIFSYDLFFEKWGEQLKKWGNINPSTFLILREGTNIAQFNAKIGDFIKSKEKSLKTTLFIRRFSDRYLYNKYENGIQAGGRITYVKLFSIIALFILVIACINFMNLSTAKASKRIKEVGVKKAIGAGRKRLIIQHIGESMLQTFLALFVAIGFVFLLIPQFNEITGKHLQFSFDPGIIFFILGITIFTGLISGSYPALYLSGFRPVNVIKGKLNTSIGELWSRKGLVIFQFTISVVLIVSVLVIYKQIALIQTKNLGYDKDNVICLKKEGRLEKDLSIFLSEIKKIPGVVNVSNSSSNLTENHSSTTGGITYEGWHKGADTRFAYMDIDYDFFETLGMEIKEGRSYSRKFGSEDSKIMFNEAGIKLMGIRNPIGKTVRLWDEEKQIIGVVKDFNFESFYNEIKPCFFRLMPADVNFGSNIWVKIKAGTETATISQLQKFYKEYDPGFPFAYKFLDEDYQTLYESENRVSILSRYFAGVAIIISCLGLFGLAAFTAERRRKEIGVRKVFGSSEISIIYLLSGGFTKLVLISILIALPASYLIARYWLNSFAYRIDLTIWYFLSAGSITIFIVWVTVGMQALKAANINPSQCLRNE